LFQARATAESILANVQAPDVQEAVSDLLFEIDSLEAARQSAESDSNDESEGNEDAPTPESNDE
jgi:hypothetical protein